MKMNHNSYFVILLATLFLLICSTASGDMLDDLRPQDSGKSYKKSEKSTEMPSEWVLFSSSAPTGDKYYIKKGLR
jgi:hypothetical protein